MNSKRIAIFGYNPLSFELAKRLDRQKHQIIIVDSDEERLALAAKKGFNTAIIDYRNDDELIQIGIDGHIEILFCFFPEDHQNVFLTLSARALTPDLEIISVIETPESEDKLLAAGASLIINPYEICGKNIYERIKKPAISELIDHVVFGRTDLNLSELEIPPGSILENSKSSDLKLDEKHNLILIGIIDKELGEDLHFALSDKDHTLDPGDILVVLGSSREIRAFTKEIENIKEIH